MFKAANLGDPYQDKTKQKEVTVPQRSQRFLHYDSLDIFGGLTVFLAKIKGMRSYAVNRISQIQINHDDYPNMLI